MTDERVLKERENKLVRLDENIRISEQYRDAVLASIKRIEFERERGLIGDPEYEARMNSKHNGMNYPEWFRYYEDYIARCRKESEDIRKSVKIMQQRIAESAQNIAVQEKAQESKGAKDYVPAIKNSLFLALVIIAGISLFMLLEPAMTGFVVNLGGRTPASITTTGFSVEGLKWADVMGSREYERCMKVYSNISFDDVVIEAKITSAKDIENLRFSLRDNTQENLPGDEIDSCRVSDYSSIWKSCSIEGVQMQEGDYWICAYASDGNSEEVYYTLAYQMGEEGETALWTGKYWQKLRRSSYTMGAEFVKWQE